MTFIKGQSGNPSGRKLGSINQESRKLKSNVALFVEGRIENIDDFNESLEPKLQMALFLKLLDFVLPKPVYVPEEDTSEDFYETARRDANEVQNLDA